MPVYESSLTGEHKELSEDYVKAFPKGAWRLVKKESPSEARERERAEARKQKVELEFPEDSPDKPAKGSK